MYGVHKTSTQVIFEFSLGTAVPSTILMSLIG